MLRKAQLIASQRVSSLIGLTIATMVVAAPFVVARPATAQMPPSQFGSTTIAYRVIVDSADPQVLQQVRQVDSAAFFQQFADNRDRIQAGAFASATGAKERVDALGRLGIRATAYNTQGQVVYQPGGQTPQQPYYPPNTPPGGNPNTPGPVKKMPRGYYAIVPVDRDQIGVTFEAFQRLGIPEAQITFGNQLRGWHVGVGVYSTRSAAESMSQFLNRKGGFDARTYYEP
jgi:hypothetical protein